MLVNKNHSILSSSEGGFVSIQWTIFIVTGVSFFPLLRCGGARQTCATQFPD